MSAGKFIRLVFFSAIAILLSIPAGPGVQADEGAPAAWETTYDRPAFEIGGNVSEDGGAAEFNLLVPLIFSDGRDLLFLGADAKIFEFNPNGLGDTVYNVGAYLGYRSVLDNNAGVVGFWAGLDHLRTDQSNDFNRIIVGAEYFGKHAIARVNAFVPLDSTSDQWSTTSGGFVSTYNEKIPSGFDAEVGARFALPTGLSGKPGEIRLFAGGYDFIGLDDNGGDVLGARARFEVDLYPFADAVDTRLSLSAAYAFDSYNGDQISAGIKLSIPLGIPNKVESSHGKDPDIVELDSYGQDLFQPVVRNREPVSRIRLKKRELAQTGGTGGVALRDVCGGASGFLTLNSGLATTIVRQGALIGMIDPSGAAIPLRLNLATMVAPDGRTLEEILVTKPASINTTLKFDLAVVNFAAQKVVPSAAVSLSSTSPSRQTITDATVTINGSNCSLNLTIQVPAPQGLTLSSICGGKTRVISLNAGLRASSIKQGDIVGTIDPNGSGASLKLDIGSMVAPNGKTLTQLLASKPTTLNSTFKFPPSLVDFSTQRVEPALAVSLTSSLPAKQRILEVTLSVNSKACALEVAIEEEDPGPDGLTLATVCGGPSAAIAVNPGLSSASVQQGDILGFIDPAGAAAELKLEISLMVDPSGKTLSELLASKPLTLNSTFTFSASVVDFGTQNVQPSAAVALTSGLPENQRVKGVTLTVNSTICSLRVDVEPNLSSSITLDTICGGINADIPMHSLHPGAVLSSPTIRQGDLVGTIEPSGVARPLVLQLASMIDANGTTLSQLLASKPTTLDVILKFPSSIVDLSVDIVEPSPIVANANTNLDWQRLLRFEVIIHDNDCSITMKNGLKGIHF